MWTVHPTALEASTSVKGMYACGQNAETDSLMDGLTDKEGLPINSTQYLGLCPPYRGRHQSPHTHTANHSMSTGISFFLQGGGDPKQTNKQTN